MIFPIATQVKPTHSQLRRFPSNTFNCYVSLSRLAHTQERFKYKFTVKFVVFVSHWTRKIENIKRNLKNFQVHWENQPAHVHVIRM